MIITKCFDPQEGYTKFNRRKVLFVKITTVGQNFKIINTL